ncbi:hypothetical protein [Actinomycetospora termitidis]|uniref:Uncharacterized protein n=1 Tax=Actinomycetospora termitidis TaxID=3053470 RepID=A0ABT7MJL9_9PSEU|nr:hypothetical protein [Actinomycetospora sp. Odt1-22]MDL5160182.1 hypothetical protein [Actinomycetospora sp. Odt1-22]
MSRQPRGDEARPPHGGGGGPPARIAVGRRVTVRSGGEQPGREGEVDDQDELLVVGKIQVLDEARALALADAPGLEHGDRRGAGLVEDRPDVAQELLRGTGHGARVRLGGRQGRRSCHMGDGDPHPGRDLAWHDHAVRGHEEHPVPDQRLLGSVDPSLVGTERRHDLAQPSAGFGVESADPGGDDSRVGDGRDGGVDELLLAQTSRRDPVPLREQAQLVDPARRRDASQALPAAEVGRELHHEPVRESEPLAVGKPQPQLDEAVDGAVDVVGSGADQVGDGGTRGVGAEGGDRASGLQDVAVGLQQSGDQRGPDAESVGETGEVPGSRLDADVAAEGQQCSQRVVVELGQVLGEGRGHEVSVRRSMGLPDGGSGPEVYPDRSGGPGVLLYGDEPAGLVRTRHRRPLRR